MAGILLLAAGLKGYQLATEPVAAADVFTSRWFLVVLVEFELVFGLWLLTGCYPRVTWMIALIVFVGFGEISLYKALAGENSCGCFGKVQVSPWYTLVLDLVIVGALIRFRPTYKAEPNSSHRSRLLIFAVVACAVGIPGGIAMTTYTPTRLSTNAQLISDSEFVVLEPETWIGHRCPLLKYIDVADRLQRGKWVVVLYRHDCPKCERVIRQYEMLALRQRGMSRAAQIALIEIPPYDAGHESRAGSVCLQGKLLPERNWFVQVPMALQLDEGQVVPVEESFRFHDDQPAQSFRVQEVEASQD